MLDDLFKTKVQIYPKEGRALDGKVIFGPTAFTGKGIEMYSTAQDIDDMFGKVDSKTVYIIKEITTISEGDKLVIDTNEYIIKKVKRLADINGIFEGWGVAI